MKIKRAEKNMKLWKDIQIGEVYLGVDTLGFETKEVCMKISESSSFNLVRNKILTPTSLDSPRKIFFNAELHLNDK